MSIHPITGVNRRRFLAGSATLAASASVLAACGGGNNPSANTEVNPNTGAKTALPTYKAIEVPVQADLKGTEVVQDVYFSYPNPPFTSVEHPVGSGGELRAMLMTYSPPPTPVAQNSYWQLMNKNLGVEFKPDLVPEADYIQKFSTVIAGGGDLPEIVQAPLWLALPRLDQLIKNSFTDLTEHLSGDAVLKYPNLANIPSGTWQNALNQGIIWGVPIPRPLFPTLLFVRTDLSEAAGFSEPPKSQEEFLEWGKALTNKAKQQYAFSGASKSWMDETLGGMYELPTNWQLDGETLVESYEHPAYYDALDFAKKLWDLGYFHPDTPGLQVTQQKTNFWNGSCVSCEDGIGWAPEAKSYPKMEMGARAPWTKDGTKVHAHQNTGVFSVNALKKGLEPAKVEEYLNIMDYLAAPFGSQEYTAINFGIEGQQYTIKDGSPVPDTSKAQDLAVNFKYVAAAPQALYAADTVLQETYQRFHKVQTEMATGLVPDPCVGLRSETKEKNGQYKTAIQDARVDYIVGRKSLDAVKEAVGKYQTDIQPKAKEELLAALKSRGDI